MSCEDIRNLAVLASFGEASPQVQASVREHAARCPACAAELRALKEGIGLLAHVPRETPSVDTLAAIGGMLMKEGPRGGPKRSFVPWAAAAAVLIAAVALGVVWKNRSDWPPKFTPVANPEKGTAPGKAVAATTKPPLDPDLEWTSVSDRLETVASHLSDLTGTRATTVNASTTPPTDSEEGDDLDGLYERLDSFSAGIEKL